MALVSGVSSSQSGVGIRALRQICYGMQNHRLCEPRLQRGIVGHHRCIHVPAPVVCLDYAACHKRRHPKQRNKLALVAQGTGKNRAGDTYVIVTFVTQQGKRQQNKPTIHVIDAFCVFIWQNEIPEDVNIKMQTLQIWLLQLMFKPPGKLWILSSSMRLKK